MTPHHSQPVQQVVVQVVMRSVATETPMMVLTNQSYIMLISPEGFRVKNLDILILSGIILSNGLVSA